MLVAPNKSVPTLQTFAEEAPPLARKTRIFFYCTTIAKQNQSYAVTCLFQFIQSIFGPATRQFCVAVRGGTKHLFNVMCCDCEIREKFLFGRKIRRNIRFVTKICVLTTQNNETNFAKQVAKSWCCSLSSVAVRPQSTFCNKTAERDCCKRGRKRKSCANFGVISSKWGR